MAKIARIGDLINTGHGCDVEAPILGGLNTKVFCEGILVAVQGDLIAPHTILVEGVCVPHVPPQVINEGSSKVFVGGIPIARQNDSADLGFIKEGSNKAFAGG